MLGGRLKILQDTHEALGKGLIQVGPSTAKTTGTAALMCEAACRSSAKGRQSRNVSPQPLGRT